MRRTLLLVLYNLLLPVVALLAAPGWIRKMAQRGGLSGRLWERLGIFERDAEFERTGGVYMHAVSVGEVLIALRLIGRWRERDPDETFVLAATTSTGFSLAEEKAPEGVRVIYSPVDFPWLVAGMFRRFEPRLLVLVESELWPNLLWMARRRGVPTVLANARLSPRSVRRYRKLSWLAQPLLELVGTVLAQAEEHAEDWRGLGIPPERVQVTGSVKFDQEGVAVPRQRPEFTEMVEAFGKGRPVLMAVSTHQGEEARIVRAVSGVAGLLPVIVPRHAERRAEVTTDLVAEGCEVVLRSDFARPRDGLRAVLVVDSTGELRDWTAEADVVVIGKSFLARGGQNPTEAIAAGLPVVCGPHMENFEPLMSQLREAGAVREARLETLGAAVEEVLGNAKLRREMTGAANAILKGHRGATARTLDALR
jgi:3-deoxy-D-manno-octulosonic-acid transferase